MTRSNGDYYHRLKVLPAASHDDIVRSYRRLAVAAHPDTNPDDPAAARRFREITEAYEVLADPARRAAYDGREGDSEARVGVASSRAAAPGVTHSGPDVFLDVAASTTRPRRAEVPITAASAWELLAEIVEAWWR